MLNFTLSAGHSLVTPGKQTPDGMKEWSFNASVVSKMMLLLAGYKDVAVLRLDDPTGQRDISLKERADRSDSFNARFHLDIHANAFGSGWNDANGIETFTYKLSGESYEIGKKLQNALVAATGLKNRGVKNGDHLYMINSPKAPSCLVECGFMTNQKEAALLKSDSYRTTVANALVKTLVEHFKLVKTPPPPKPAPKPAPAPGTLYRVLVGVLYKIDGPKTINATLKAAGFDSVIKED
jgi:N-acetylmuramoyl-L-alanine amidase